MADSSFTKTVVWLIVVLLGLTTGCRQTSKNNSGPLKAGAPFAYPVGPCSGDLSGNYPGCTVTGIRDSGIPAPSGVDTNLQFNSSLSWSPVTQAYYGTGGDGAATVDGTATPTGMTKNSSTSYTLNRDVFYTSLNCTINGTIATNGFRLFSTGITTLGAGCVVDNSGQPGANGTGSGTSAGGAAGVVGSIGSVANAGTGGSAAAVGNAGSCGTVNVWGGNGGAGGNDGGAGGTGSPLNTAIPPQSIEQEFLQATWGGGVSTLSLRPTQGGCGGGGGAVAANGGGGGGGGGNLLLASWVLAGSGTIQANGGNGGNGLASSNGTGGGGGGGGVVTVITNDATNWTGSINAFPGLGGLGGVVNPGTIGLPGSPGVVYFTPGRFTGSGGSMAALLNSSPQDSEGYYHVGQGNTPTIGGLIPVYVIWYNNPTHPWTSAQKTLTTEWINNVAKTSWWTGLRDYVNWNGRFATGLVFTASVDDPETEGISWPTSLASTTGDVAAVNNAMQNATLPTDLNGLYLVLPSYTDVDYTPGSPAGIGGHHYETRPNTVTTGFYAFASAVRLRWSVAGSILTGSGVFPGPNGDAGYDSMMGALAHEVLEAIAYGWQANSGGPEIADSCEGPLHFSNSLPGPSGGIYNLTFIDSSVQYYFLAQDYWSREQGGYCYQGLGPSQTIVPCNVNADCTWSHICAGNRCAYPNCSDGIQNGNETDVDCGATCGISSTYPGSLDGTCTTGKKCVVSFDCVSKTCTAGHCI